MPAIHLGGRTRERRRWDRGGRGPGGLKRGAELWGRKTPAESETPGAGRPLDPARAAVEEVHSPWEALFPPTYPPWRAIAPPGRTCARDPWHSPRCQAIPNGPLTRIARCRGPHRPAPGTPPDRSEAWQAKTQPSGASPICSIAGRTTATASHSGEQTPETAGNEACDSLTVKSHSAVRCVRSWAQRDLNPRPSDYESAALTA